MQDVQQLISKSPKNLRYDYKNIFKRVLICADLCGIIAELDMR